MDLSRFAPAPHDTPDQPRPTHRWPQWWWSRLQLSANTHRSFGHDAPRMRGWSHLAMAVVWPVLSVLLAMRAESTTGLIGALVFAFGMQAMFTLSALTHWRRWGVWTTEALFRLDHTGIFLAIAGSVTPFALLALSGWARPLVLVVAWGATVAGIVIALWPARTPVGFGNTSFIGLGVLILPFLPMAHERMGWGGIGLLLAGGAFYIAGAILLAFQRPRLDPEVFGYHEVWHAMVVAAALLHYLMVHNHLLPVG